MQRIKLTNFVLATLLVFSDSDQASAQQTPWTKWEREDRDHWGRRIGRRLGLSGFERSIAIVVTVGAYEGGWPPLESPAYDLRKMTQYLKNEGEFDIVYTLSDADVSYDNVRDLMTNELLIDLQNGDRVLFYYSGHGQTKPLRSNRKVGYLVAPQAIETDAYEDMIGMRELRIWWDDIAAVATQSLFIIDACFSGIGLQSASALSEKEIKQLSRRGHHMMTAGLDTEEAWGDITKWGGSLFTHVLVSGMSGAADRETGDKDGIVSLKELWSYTAEKVRTEAPTSMTPQLGYLEVNMPGEFFFTTDSVFETDDRESVDQVTLSKREFDEIQERLRQLEAMLQTGEAKSDPDVLAAIQENKPNFENAPVIVKLGVLLGFSGPIESLTPPMAESAELALKEASESGVFLNGARIEAIRADSTCIDASAAIAAATQLIEKAGVSGIVGADCSGVSSAVLQNVINPAESVMISPSASSPALSKPNERDRFFRTTPPDDRQGEVLARTTWDRKIRSVAVTYTNNDYGEGLADSFAKAFEELGGDVTVIIPHEDGKSDYSAEIGSLAASGGEALVVAGYADGGGAGLVDVAFSTGAFDTFILPDGMYTANWVSQNLSKLEQSFGLHPYEFPEGRERFEKLNVDFDTTSPFAAEAYDAAALIVLAMQAAGSVDPEHYKEKVLAVANAPGEKIFPGELENGLRILAQGGEIDYVGASGVELTAVGDAAGNYREYEITSDGERTARYQ